MIDVKICGVCRPGDARVAADAGAAYIGVIVGAGGPRRRSVADAERIYAAAEGVRRVGVFADASPAEVADVARLLALDVVQLHGAEGPDIVAAVAAAGPWSVWKAVRPLDASSLGAELAQWRGRVDALLVDGDSPGGRGGMGVRAPWDALAAARWNGDGPRLVLAGGLRPANVAEAVARLRPDVVDVSSGVEAAVGEKDEAFIRAFVRAARNARPADAGSQDIER